VRHFDLVIIGTGSGNSILDSRFADWNVAIVEKDIFGGTCLNVGCIPTKMFVHTGDVANYARGGAKYGVDSELHGVRWTDIRDRIFGRIDPIAAGGRQYRTDHQDNKNVTVFSGQGRFVGDKQLRIVQNGGDEETITADKFVLAAGSRPIVPDIDGITEIEYHTSDTVMRIDELPRRMIIVGGGFIAAEFAHVFSALGVEVSLVVRSGALMRAEDEEISARFTELARQRWSVRTDTKASKVEQADGVTRLYVDGPGGPEVLEAESLLIATGRRPNTDLLDVAVTGLATDRHGYLQVDEHQQTAIEGIYGLGDISSHYQLKHVANHEMRVVRHNLLNPDSPISSDHRFVPHAVFSNPQIASVGLTEQEARARGVNYVTGIENYGSIAYGWAMEDTTGFAKLLADPATGQLLGAHIIGPQAPTVIQPLIQAMSFGLDAAAMAHGQYWIHPAMPELVENALLNLPLD
jgi:mycothione reductase